MDNEMLVMDLFREIWICCFLCSDFEICSLLEIDSVFGTFFDVCGLLCGVCLMVISLQYKQQNRQANSGSTPWYQSYN